MAIRIGEFLLRRFPFGVAVSFEPEPIGFGIKPVDEGDPELGRELAGVGDVAERCDPVPVVHGGVLEAVQLFGVDGPHAPVARLLSQGSQTLALGNVEQICSRPGRCRLGLDELASLSEGKVARIERRFHFWL